MELQQKRTGPMWNSDTWKDLKKILKGTKFHFQKNHNFINRRSEKEAFLKEMF